MDKIHLKKRERTQNWALEEKQLLLTLCEKNLKYIENKKADSQTSSLKNLAWRSIHNEFVTTFGLDRDCNRLKEQWRRMKGWARTEIQEYENRVKKFGRDFADKKKPSNLSECIWKVMENSQKYCQEEISSDDDCFKPVKWNHIEADVSYTSESSPNNNTRWEPERFTNLNQHSSNLCEVEIKEEPVNNSEQDVDADEYNAEDFQFPDHLLQGDGISRKESLRSTMLDNRYQALANLRKTLGTNNDFFETCDISLNGDSSPLMKKRKIDFDDDNHLNFRNNYEEKRKEHLKRCDIMDEQLETARINRQTAEINRQIAEETLKQFLNKKSSNLEDGMEDTDIESLDDTQTEMMSSGEAGSGAGKGGGGGGSIRSAGGSFGKMEVAHEEEFFYKQRQEQLKALRKHQIDEAKFHEESIKHHKEAIERHEKNLQSLKK